MNCSRVTVKPAAKSGGEVKATVLAMVTASAIQGFELGATIWASTALLTGGAKA